MITYYVVAMHTTFCLGRGGGERDSQVVVGVRERKGTDSLYHPGVNNIAII